MNNMQINICFRELAHKKSTTAYYEELVFDISRMLKYMTEGEIYYLLDGKDYSPDTLHYAIDEAKEMIK
ncbi:hypothetical protein [Bacillus toyonensis]|uniref:hypothetical protein n=1 Tax=Bacillus toyonensis TaxID=155322 RepID=UPI00124BD372|nr:hypothetical protein [Bacillus toyonensis]KAB2380208.1 hypothetical protein F8507_27375 [Bacillus toyonensis]